MRAMVGHEWNRMIKSRGLKISVLSGGIIAIMHVVTSVLPLSAWITSGSYPLSAYAKWMGAENGTIWPVLFYLLAPVLTVMPYLHSVIEDFGAGYVKNVLLVVTRKEYCIAKWLVTFFSAGITSVLPLTLNFVLTACFLPTVQPQPGLGVYSIFAYSMWSELFYSHPGIYVAAYLMINFVFFGLLATVGLTCSFLTNRIYVCMLIPFFLYLFVYGVTQMAGFHEWCPFAVLRPSQPVAANGGIILIECAVLFLIGGGVWLYGGKKRDVF